MDIEQLKLILEMLKGTTEEAAKFGTWWIVLHYGLEVLKVLGFVSVAITVPVVGFYMLRQASSADRLCRDIACELGVKNFDTWHGPDRARLREAIVKRPA